MLVVRVGFLLLAQIDRQIFVKYGRSLLWSGVGGQLPMTSAKKHRNRKKDTKTRTQNAPHHKHKKTEKPTATKTSSKAQKTTAQATTTRKRKNTDIALVQDRCEVGILNQGRVLSVVWWYIGIDVLGYRGTV